MQKAIIRLSKIYTVDKSTKDADLKQLWDLLSENLRQLIARTGFPIVWNELQQVNRDNISDDALDYAEEVLKRFMRNRLPGEKKLSKVKSPLAIEKCKIEIVGFDTHAESLIFEFYAITEQLIAIDNIGDKLILAKIDHREAIMSGQIRRSVSASGQMLSMIL